MLCVLLKLALELLYIDYTIRITKGLISSLAAERNRSCSREKRSGSHLKFVIVGISVVFCLFLLCTNLTLGKSKTEATTNETLNDLSLSFEAPTNNLTSNVSSLTGSALSLAQSMRNLNESTPTPGAVPYIAENKKYVFSENKTEISSPLNNSHTGEFGEGVKIAVVMPTFTAAAYDNAFYVFYQKYINVSRGVNITKDLNLLSNKVTNAPSSSASGFAMLYLLGNLKWIEPNSNVAFLTDQDVDAGTIFQTNGSNAFDVLVLGHQEYVTQREYDNFKQFVGDGGTMIILDGNVFYAEVKYDRNTENITLVKGHSWAFNGKSAWRSVNERWKNETAEWVGSNYVSNIAKFANNQFEYTPHEEQFITNPKDVILLDYNATMPTAPLSNKTGGVVVATYELNYLKGRVIALGLYSDDIITNGSFDRYFDNLVLQYAIRSQD